MLCKKYLDIFKYKKYKKYIYKGRVYDPIIHAHMEACRLTPETYIVLVKEAERRVLKIHPWDKRIIAKWTLKTNASSPTLNEVTNAITVA